MAMGAQAQAPTESQVYLSTRGGEYGLSFETVVLKGLGGDGGLFMPHRIPQADWRSWEKLSYKQLAFRIFSLFISSTEISGADLETIIDRSYSKFRDPDIVAPLKHYWDRLHILELFHGPSLSFKDCALQFLGNLFEYLLARKNAGRQGQDRHHMTVVCATSGDTGSAAIHGLKGKKDISVVILHPEGRVSPVQEAQMTTCLDANVHNLAVHGTFDDCQEIVKTLFADPNTKQALELGAVNSINWARILAQIVYYFHSYFALIGQSGNAKLGDKIRFIVPTGNFGDILAGYFAYRMGLPVEKLVIATNENDILDRFWKTGRYETRPGRCLTTEGGAQAKEATVRATLSPAMDIVVSSNFERLLWFLAYEMAATVGMDEEFNMKKAGQEVIAWFKDLKLKGGFGPVHKEILERARVVFESERVTDEETMKTICDAHSKRERGLLPLDPHAAVGVTAALRSMERTEPHVQHISLATAHPGKFPDTVKRALNMSRPDGPDPDLADGELAVLEGREKRVTRVENDWKAVREMMKELIKK